MLRRPRWETLVSALEAMQGTNYVFAPDELYTHLRCFEEKLKQTGDYHVEPSYNSRHYIDMHNSNKL
jgi:hypothetical protein